MIAAPVAATADSGDRNLSEDFNPMLDTVSSRPPKLVTLSLAFLLAGLLGCSHGSQGEQPAGAKAAGGAPSPTAGAAAAPAAVSAPATPAAHDSTAPPAATGAPSPAGAAGQAPAPQALAQDKIPAVVAKVNGTPIAKGDLIKVADQFHAQSPAMTETAEFYRKILDQLISNELLRQEATAAGVTASDEEVNKQLGELKGRFPSPEKFQEELKKNGLTEAEIGKQIRENLVMQKFVETKVVNDVKVSDADVKAFYDKNPDKLTRPERIHIRHILVGVTKTATPEDKKKAQAKADALLAKLKAGGDFAKLAEESSDDPGSKPKGGDLSWVSRGQMVKPFEDAAFALKKPNEISPVVESQFGFHIIQLLEHQDAGKVPFDEVKDRISGFLKQQQQKEKFFDHIKTLKDKAKVEIFI
ncbi:MAG TPA: peptidylprolyl isomerase [Thermoanaerobaculia bacterium]|nr:peptidylprolyl isomerase [Thermoanaerobaculia bacterium]